MIRLAQEMGVTHGRRDSLGENQEILGFEHLYRSMSLRELMLQALTSTLLVFVLATDCAFMLLPFWSVFSRHLSINQECGGKRTASGAQRDHDDHRVYGEGDLPRGLLGTVFLLHRREPPIPL